MKPSTRALAGLVVLDAAIIAGAAFLVGQITSGAVTTAVPRAEAIQTITSIAGAVVGIVTVVLGIAFVSWKRQGK